MLAISFVGTAIGSRLILDAYGAATFAGVSIFATLQQLLPFGDLGLGAVVMNRAVEYRKGRPRDWFLASLSRVVRAQIAGALVLGALGVAVLLIFLSNGGELRRLEGEQAFIIAGTLLVVANVPLSVGGRILIGLDRTHVAVLLSGVAPPVILSWILACRAFEGNAGWCYLAWPVGGLVSSLLVCGVALKIVGIRPRRLAASVLTTRVRDAADPIWGTSLAMAVISTASPIGFASDRIVLAKVVGLSATAPYALAGQIYSPLLNIISTAATPLWGSGSSRLVASRRRFLALGVGAGVAMFVAVPFYSWLVTGSLTFVSISLTLSFSGLLVVNSVALPVMMVMNSGRRIVLQARLAVCSAAVNLPLSVVAAHLLGAPGPVLASVACLALLQTLPLWVRVNRGLIPSELDLVGRN